mgnify:CR=1 FL=1
MNNKEYQEKARTTAIYPGVGEVKNGNTSALSYLTLGLNGEAGEIAEKVKKLLRDKDSVIDENFKSLLIKEVGDCIWYCSNLCDELGYSISDAMQINIDKLYSRQKRDKIKGSGDER